MMQAIHLAQSTGMRDLLIMECGKMMDEHIPNFPKLQTLWNRRVSIRINTNQHVSACISMYRIDCVCSYFAHSYFPTYMYILYTVFLLSYMYILYLHYSLSLSAPHCIPLYSKLGGIQLYSIVFRHPTHCICHLGWGHTDYLRVQPQYWKRAPSTFVVLPMSTLRPSVSSLHDSPAS